MLLDEVRNLYNVKVVNDNNVDLWLDCYRGEYPWLGGDNLASLNLAASISSELARLTTIEFESHINIEEIDKTYQNIVNNSRRFVEYGLALGGIILKPYLIEDDITIDYVTPDMFLILEFSPFGDINHIVFIDRLQKVDNYYTRLEEHQFINGSWLITNRAFKSENYNSLGDQISLKEVEDWSLLDEQAIYDIDFPLFSYFKNPQANNLNLKSNEGVSCFARALSLIQDADEQYQRILWEYQGSELAIDADVTILKNKGELPHGKERLFRNLGLDQNDGFYEVFSPEIRDSALFNGLNKILRRIEFNVGLAYGTISAVDEIEKSATEIKSSKQRSYSTVVDIQKELEKCLTHIIQILKYYLNFSNDDNEATFDFDDSLIIDNQSETTIRMQEVAAGIVRPEEYLMWRYGITEEDAIKMMPPVLFDKSEDDYIIDDKLIKERLENVNS